MASTLDPAPTPEPLRAPAIPRVLGVRRGAAPGPSLVVVGGIHGNERAGIAAAQRVLAALARDPRALRGELVVLSGNRAALDRGIRYQTKDLNRQWSAQSLARVRAQGPADPEDAELLELEAAIEAAIARARGEVHLMDLHTTSAHGIPFVLFGDTMRQRRFGFSFPLPVILGLEEMVDGVMSGYFTQRGCISLAIEGGQHDDPASVESLEACLWVGLVSAGLIDAARVPEYEAARRVLAARRKHLPPVMEVTRRHAITVEDEFRMEPGFANLDPVRGGQLLAHDARGEIRAPRDGLVILPLYQGLGSDGFFWGRRVGRTRMKATEVVRKLSLDRLLPYLPGVRRDPRDESTLRADTRVARHYPLDVFHVFGYRRIRQDGDELVVTRQPL